MHLHWGPSIHNTYNVATLVSDNNSYFLTRSCLVFSLLNVQNLQNLKRAQKRRNSIEI